MWTNVFSPNKPTPEQLPICRNVAIACKCSESAGSATIYQYMNSVAQQHNLGTIKARHVCATPL